MPACFILNMFESIWCKKQKLFSEKLSHWNALHRFWPFIDTVKQLQELYEYWGYKELHGTMFMENWQKRYQQRYQNRYFWGGETTCVHVYETKEEIRTEGKTERGQQREQRKRDYIGDNLICYVWVPLSQKIICLLGWHFLFFQFTP